MDQYFTNPETAQECWETLEDFLKGLKFSKLCFIEPSAGAGNLFYLLPVSQRIGYELDSDLCESHREYKCGDFLKVKSIPTNNTKIFFGNPPFSNINGKINLQ